MTVTMNAEALNTFMMTEFPQVAADFRVEHVAPMLAEVRLLADEKHLRPGGTVSGPAMFALADLAMYVVTLAMIGPKALSVTTNCSIDFMRKPEAGRDLIGKARLLKLGRILAVGDVLIHSEGMDAPVARASLTYSIPPR
ncbi:MAG: PaaI family thioesterase [Pararhodobacter sp.]